eukprot:scpid78340/ scgid28781/ 6-phosphofructo-2-kinase/fructose-2,6-bisphosphatase; 6-phosphofructo-2-kinase; Fructose-2,6-bisphosphatase
MGFRYPRGENYYDIIDRVEPYIVELESNKSPVICICHNASIRCLYGYFTCLRMDRIAEIDVPLHTVIKVTPQTYGYTEERFTLDPDTGEIKKAKLLDSHQSFIKKSKQKLSFDMDSLPSLGIPKIDTSPKLGRKFKSFNNLAKVAKEAEADSEFKS